MCGIPTSRSTAYFTKNIPQSTAAVRDVFAQIFYKENSFSYVSINIIYLFRQLNETVLKFVELWMHGIILVDAQILIMDHLLCIGIPPELIFI